MLPPSYTADLIINSTSNHQKAINCNQVRFGFLIEGYTDLNRAPTYNLRISKSSLSPNAVLFSQGTITGYFIMYRISCILQFRSTIISSIMVTKPQFKNLRT